MKKQLKKITTSCLIAATLLASTGVFAMDSEEFNRRMDEGMKAYIQKDYATATNLFQRLYNEGSLDYEQEQRVLKFLDSSKSNQYGLPSKNQSNTQTTTQQTTNSNSLSTAEFDSGMAKGIWYFNKGMYYEAKDEFQWFCDYNWGRMNAGQQKYALDYLGSAKQKIQQLTQNQYNTPQYTSSVQCYKNTNIPIYTAGKCIASGTMQKDTITYGYQEGEESYVYEFTNTNDITNYISYITNELGYPIIYTNIHTEFIIQISWNHYLTIIIEPYDYVYIGFYDIY